MCFFLNHSERKTSGRFNICDAVHIWHIVIIIVIIIIFTKKYAQDAAECVTVVLTIFWNLLGIYKSTNTRKMESISFILRDKRQKKILFSFAVFCNVATQCEQWPSWRHSCVCFLGNNTQLVKHLSIPIIIVFSFFNIDVFVYFSALVYSRNTVPVIQTVCATILTWDWFAKTVSVSEKKTFWLN